MIESMKESEKWLALCDPFCQQKKSFPNCECCDIALEYRYYKQKEQAERGRVMAFHDRLFRAKERWAFAEGYCATFTLKLRAFIRAFFERS